MKAIRLGCITGPAVFAALIATTMVAVSVLASGGSMYSPGALNAESGMELGGVSSHAAIAGNCKACHAAPWEADSMDDRCSACHVNIAAELRDPQSVHGRMMEIDPQAQCRTCHPEHKGPNALLTVLEGWQFPHEVARFKLNSHQLTAEKEPFLCADCHGEDVTQFDILTCRMCHIRMDMAFMVEHQVLFGENCLECHDGVERFGHDFDHNQFDFKLSGKHAGVQCAQCHARSTTLAALQTTSRNCVSCHTQDDPHQGVLGSDCASCHSPEGWTPSSFDHNRSVFKLTGAHAQVTCEQCHRDRLYKGTPLDCFSCHQQIEPHMGQFGTVCEQCHNTEAWKPARFDHNTTSFPLTGSHINAECKACHVTGIYKNTPRDCFSCHATQDAHKGQFGRNCAACHQTTTWARGKFDHNATAFPLIGKHASVNCLSCHQNGVFRGTPKNCFSCHAKDDHHAGQLGRECSTCHIPTGWANITFDHAFTAFPLTGAHTSVSCTQCHVSAQFNISTECASCHQEPAFHAGAFGANCTQCHNTSAWSSAVFVGTHPVALGQNFLDHHGATCKTCHTTTVHTFTCLACHETNPLPPDDATPVPTDTPVATSPANEPTVITSVTPASIQVGDTSQLTVNFNNVPVQGYTSTEFTCTYDPTLLDVSNISVGDLFGQDPVSGMFGPDNGSFILAVAGSNGRRVLAGGSAFTFHARGLQAGSADVDCKARVSEGLNALEDIASLPASITIASVSPTGTTMPAQASITGQVLASKQVTIRLYDTGNSLIAETTTNPDGMFELSAPGAMYTITASTEGFLGAQGSVDAISGGTTSLSAVNLIPGDIDANGVIDPMDALTIRMNYGQTTPTAADLNNDGVIDVLDLGIVAENYGKSGALVWP